MLFELIPSWLRDLTSSLVKKMFAGGSSLIKAEQRKENSTKLRDSEASCRRADSSQLLLFKTAETENLAGYRRISYATGIVRGTGTSRSLCLHSIRLGSVGYRVRLVSTLGRLCVHAPWQGATF